VNFELTDEQRMIKEGIGTILSRMAGPERCRTLLAEGAYDAELEKVLTEHGYLGMLSESGAGALEAVLMVEQVAKALGTVAIGALAVVGPALGLSELSGPIGLTIGPVRDGPVRFATSPGALLVAEGCEAFLCETVDGQVRPTSWSYPAAQVSIGSRRSLGVGSADTMMSWWRITIAAEIVGNATACLEVLLHHVKERNQFGRSIASFQALQHRLAQLYVQIEGSRWLTYRAAWVGGQPAEAAMAVAHSAAAGRRAVRECHQICGALGLTTEFDLHMWTMRVRSLCSEAGGLYGSRVDAGRLRWCPPSSSADQ
jgi:alkylation response protein AidB-like acyl-CoA dehydrogenase